MSKIVFNEWDLIKVHLTPSHLESIKKVGLLKLDEAHTGHRKSMTAEFFHLSMQELLSVVHIVSNSLTSKYMLEKVFASGQFNMALLYLFGVQYDTQSQWISDVRFAVQPSKLEVDKDTQKQFQLFLQSLCKNCSDDSSKKILLCQLVHEGQVEEQAKLVVNHVAPEGNFCIQGTTMTGIDLRAVAFVCQYSQLKSVTFQRVNADDTFIEIMSSLLLKNHRHTLRVLDIAENRIRSAGAVSIAKYLNESNSLQVLEFSDNSVGLEGVQALAESLKGNNSLCELHLSNCRTLAGGAKSLGEMLKENKTLQTLDVSGGSLFSEGAKAIAIGLMNNNTLKTLEITGNCIGTNGAIMLAEVLKYTTSLLKLDIRFNSIGQNGATAIAGGLKENTSVRFLDIRHNGIQKEGAVAIAQALEQNPRLRTLKISHNSIGDEGAKAFAGILKQNYPLQNFKTKANRIGPEGAKAMGLALKCNKYLRKLDISENECTEDETSVLRRMCKFVKSLKT